MFKIEKIDAYTRVIEAEDNNDIKLAHKQMCAIRKAIRREKANGVFNKYFEICEKEEKLFINKTVEYK